MALVLIIPLASHIRLPDSDGQFGHPVQLRPLPRCDGRRRDGVRPFLGP